MFLWTLFHTDHFLGKIITNFALTGCLHQKFPHSDLYNSIQWIMHNTEMITYKVQTQHQIGMKIENNAYSVNIYWTVSQKICYDHVWTIVTSKETSLSIFTWVKRRCPNQGSNSHRIWTRKPWVWKQHYTTTQLSHTIYDLYTQVK